MAVLPKEAIDIICKNITKDNYEIVPIENTISRICAQNIYANTYLPKFDNSAMDGYAIVFEDKENELTVTDTIFAGDDKNITLEKNCCTKIMTGARIPHNATAIVPKENVEIINETTIKVPTNIKLNQHIRFIGEDIKKDDLLIVQNEEINMLLEPYNKLAFEHHTKTALEEYTSAKTKYEDKEKNFKGSEDIQNSFNELSQL